MKIDLPDNSIIAEKETAHNDQLFSELKELYCLLEHEVSLINPRCNKCGMCGNFGNMTMCCMQAVLKLIM